MKEIKAKGSLDFESQGLFYENIFGVFDTICMFFVFLNNKLKINYRSEKIKTYVLCGDVGSPQRPLT